MNTYEIIEKIKVNEDISLIRVVEYNSKENDIKKVEEEYSSTIKYEKFSVNGLKPSDIVSREITFATKLD